MEHHLHVETQEWEYVEGDFNSTHFRPLWDVSSLRKKFKMLVKKKIPTGNPTCPPFGWPPKQILSTLVNKCNVLPHRYIPNIDDNNAIMDPAKGCNNNYGREEGDTEVVESTNVISIVDTVDHLLQNETDVSANLNELPRTAIESIPASERLQGKGGLMKMGTLIATQFLKPLK